MLSQLRAHFPEMVPFADSLYRDPSHLIAGSGLISSARGAQQGDPLGPVAIHGDNLSAKILAAEPLPQAISELPSKQSDMHLLRYC
eukprot:4713413-Amphidinium_carterae.1